MPNIPQRAKHDRDRNLGLDLVRSTAIVLVLLSHWANNIVFWFGVKSPQRVFFAGDLGVTLFFALSGFLIGRILLEIAYQAPTWRNLWVFLVRRWMRTLPLYFIWLSVLLVFFPPSHDVTNTVFHFATLTQNLFRPMSPDYWFAVSWSLTVEEWFYLLFGCAIIGLAMRFVPLVALWLPLSVFLLGPIFLRLSVPGFIGGDWPIHQEVIFHIDQIAYGVILAELWRRDSRLFAHPLPLLAIGVVMIAWVWFFDLPLSWRYAVALGPNVTIIGCTLCLPAALCLKGASRPIAAVIRAISAQSYALYLIHLTILVDLAQGLLWNKVITREEAVLLAVILPFILSWLSYRFIEAPILARRPPQRLVRDATDFVTVLRPPDGVIDPAPAVRL